MQRPATHVAIDKADSPNCSPWERWAFSDCHCSAGVTAFATRTMGITEGTATITGRTGGESTADTTTGIIDVIVITE